MDEGGIRLTSYFGERRRIGGQFVADALIEYYGQSKLSASVVLRGAEDLPLTVVAVDAVSRMGGVLDETRRINHRGLITVERARFFSGDIEPVLLQEAADGEATRLTVYFCRQDTVFGVPAFEVMCELLRRRGIGGATALAGVDGTVHGRRQRAHFFSRNADVPMMVDAVGAGEAIGAILPEIGDLLRDPRITVAPVNICKRNGELIRTPGTPPPYDDDGLPLWQKLTVYAREDSRHHGQPPLHRSLVRRLRSAGMSGATTQLGVWGFHGDHTPHGGQHLLSIGQQVPAVTVVIDAPHRISAAFGIIDELTTDHGLVTSENVAVSLPVAAPADLNIKPV